MVFEKEIEKKCTDAGIAVIKQVGDIVIVKDDNLKVF